MGAIKVAIKVAAATIDEPSRELRRRFFWVSSMTKLAERGAGEINTPMIARLQLRLFDRTVFLTRFDWNFHAIRACLTLFVQFGETKGNSDGYRETQQIRPNRSLEA